MKHNKVEPKIRPLTLFQVALRQHPSKSETQWQLRIRASDAGWPFPRSSEVLISIYINGTDLPSKIKPSLLRESQNEHSPIIINQTVLVVSVDSSPGKVSLFKKL